MQFLKANLAARHCHEPLVETLTIRANKQGSFKAPERLDEHALDGTPCLKQHLNAAGRTLWSRSPKTLLRRQVIAPFVPPELFDHLIEALLELIAPR